MIEVADAVLPDPIDAFGGFVTKISAVEVAAQEKDVLNLIAVGLVQLGDFCGLGFFAYPPEKVYSSDQTARSGRTGIWSNSWMSAGRSVISGALRNS